MTILCTIDLETREVSLPAGQVIASYDHNVDVIRFQAETIPGFSLNTSSIKIAAQGPNKARHDYAVDPSTVQIEEETGYITFDWPIPAGVTEMPIGTFKYGDRGQLIFAVCAEIISGNTVSKAWHSDDGIITVVAHLEPESGGGEDPEEEATNRQMIGQLRTDVTAMQTEIDGKADKIFATPEDFGAVGDGVADDTTAVRNALKYSIDNGVKLLLTKTYYITASLLTSADYDGTVVIDVEGSRPLKNYIYAIDVYGGIKFANGINVFEGISIQGSIHRVSFMPVARTQTGSIFKDCVLRAFMFSDCSVSNVLAFCYNTDVRSVTQICNSRFLTVYYFAKCDSEDEHYGFIDSKLTGNYINGGSEMNENHCFEWWTFNGAEVSGNFIDYYQTIYYPNSNINFTFQGPVSVGNQYQVFRYLYYPGENCGSGIFSSVSDCFNSTNPTKLAKLTTYVKYTYTGYDSQEHDIPPCILLTLRTWNVSIINAILQNNVGNCIFVKEALTEYVYAKAEFTFVSTVNSAYSSCVSSASSLYTAGSFKNNLIKIPFAMVVESLPSINASRSDYYPGQLVTMNNTIYRYVNVYNSGTGTYTPTWVDVTAYM